MAFFLKKDRDHAFLLLQCDPLGPGMVSAVRVVPADAETYFRDADIYLRMAEEIIGLLSGRMLTELKEKLQ